MDVKLDRKDVIIDNLAYENLAQEERIKELENKIVLKTYLVLSYTNYGETVTVINAKDDIDLKEIASDCDTVWDGYEVIEIDTSVRGQIGCYGGDT